MVSLPNLVAGVAAGIVALDGVYMAINRGNEPVRPPGSDDEKTFLSRCIRCGRCIQACPYKTLKAADAASGASVGTPVVDVLSQACRLCEDFPCVAACPTEALHGISDRLDVNMGLAVVNEDACLSFSAMRCEVCYRSCPLIDTAITIDYRMREEDSIHAVFAPVISEENCVGCGLCVERCPVHELEPAIVIDTSEETRAKHREYIRQRSSEGEG